MRELPAHCAVSADLDARFAEAVEAREGLRETDKKETRLFVQTHPDVLVIPPDPPQMMIKVDQVRRVIETIYYRPCRGAGAGLHFYRLGVHEGGGEFAAESAGRASGVRHDFSAVGECGGVASDHPIAVDGFRPRRPAGGRSGALPGRASSGMEAAATCPGCQTERRRAGPGAQLSMWTLTWQLAPTRWPF